jgi:hypothetical protein
VVLASALLTGRGDGHMGLLRGGGGPCVHHGMEAA